ncbi:MAG: hypothetical protein WD226_10120 [Planctomycetota bacterium]
MTTTLVLSLVLTTLPWQGADATDAEVRAAYERLAPDARREVVEWFGFEARHAGTFQGQLVAYLVDNASVDPGLSPPPAPIPHFDCETHAPAQIIPRRSLAPDSKEVEAARRRFLPTQSSRQPERAWSWDWPRGTLRKHSDVDDTDRVFRNALRGLVPDFDLAHALLLGRLDDGAERTVLAAFGHAYTDRLGGVYPGVTLYDAWNSGATMEMPDVDILGVLHTVLDYRKVRAPIPVRQQDPTYAKVGELFVRARRYRSLREALADTYLDGEPFDRNGFGGVLLNLHGLWETVASDPARLELPGVDERDAWLDDLAKRLKDEALWTKALRRRDQLVSDRTRVRAVLVRVMRDFGAFD